MCLHIKLHDVEEQLDYSNYLKRRNTILPVENNF